MSFSFNPMNHPLCLSLPERLSSGVAWQEHIPFAMFVVSAHRPRFVVELGSYLGDSYCAFCQTIKTLGLEAQCYAVDTWQGDKHSGYYGEEILANLREHHDPRYSGFSRLLRCTFDEALPHIPDGSADLLHIDGLHTYEAVRHDFENWLPKLSPRGIVLFHDTNVREADFGVHRLWAELKTSYPSFEFLHGHGLGVLAVGKVESADLQALFRATPEEQTIVREFFFQLGRRVFNEGRIKRLEASINDLNFRLNETINQSQTLHQTLRQTLDFQQTRIGELEKAGESAEATIIKLTAQIDSIVNSKAWKFVERFWQIKNSLRR
jgi:hypothetical protein